MTRKPAFLSVQVLKARPHLMMPVGSVRTSTFSFQVRKEKARYGKRNIRIEFDGAESMPSTIMWKNKRDPTPWDPTIHIIHNEAIVEAIKLFYSDGGYGGMTLEEFLHKAVPRK